jgi:hypothetical protein
MVTKLVSLFAHRSARLISALLLLVGTAPQPAAAQQAYGLYYDYTYPALMSFQISSQGPIIPSALLPITGVVPGDCLVGIDIRPGTGELFALGYCYAAEQAQLYRIAPATGTAIAVGLPHKLRMGAFNQYSPRIGFDFNPVEDYIRVTSINRTNLRLNPNTGVLIAQDDALSYVSADWNTGNVPAIGASAYTNSYRGATTTTLYDVDEQNGSLAQQATPNSGLLHTVGQDNLNFRLNTSLSWSDLEIYFDPLTRTNVAYLAVGTSGVNPANYLYRVDLSAGTSTKVADFATNVGGSGFVGLLDIAIVPAAIPTAAVPAALAKQVALYPNPARSVVAVALPPELVQHPVTMCLVNSLGQQVWQQSLPITQGAQLTTVSLAGVARDLYTVQLTTAAGTLFKRLAVE